MQQAASFLVAHRGDRCGGVENTLGAFSAAAKAGARYAECDIQFSRDFMPLVIHDNHLKRLCGADNRVSESFAGDVRRICRPHFQLSSLPELLIWLSEAQGVTLFIEIKPPVRRRLTDRSIARRIGNLLPEALLERVVIISQSARLVDICAREIACPVGWVAEGPRPPKGPIQYVFMPWQKAGEMRRWQERGIRVGLYTVNDAAKASELIKEGADMVECNHYSEMVHALA